MTTQELDEIETSLGIMLPGNYRDWALRLPRVGEETKSWHFAFNDKDAILETNSRLQQEGCQEQFWPPELFCIGETDGNHYFISLRVPDQIYYTNHDDGPYFESASWKDCAYQSTLEFYAEVERANLGWIADLN